MANKNHAIIVRVSERQLRFLTEALIKEQRTKSQILRDALNQYLIEKSPRHEITERNSKRLGKNE
jgi:hypothetical protein